jgi:integrase
VTSRPWTPEEQRRFLAELPERLRQFATISLHTGLRSGEVSALLWSDVDLDRRLLTVRKSKNGRPRTVPLVGPGSWTS